MAHVTFLLHDQATHIPSSSIILITTYKNFLHVAVFYMEKCFYQKSTFILHLHSYDYFSRLVYSLNIRQYVSIIVLKRMRTQALS